MAAELGSTSDVILAAARDGAAQGFAVQALRQTAGRGTRGRPWQGPSGNLALSVLLRPPGPARLAGQWSLLAAVALAEALAPDIPARARLRLKWPNDLLLDGGKLSGILVDTELRPDGMLDWLVIGCGANLVAAPDVPGRRTACLARPGLPPPDARAVGARLLARLGHWRAVLLDHGFAPVRAAWLARSVGLGAPLDVTLGEQVFAGAFAGISDDGQLILRLADGERRFASGDTRGWDA